jgi:hypothetical protein
MLGAAPEFERALIRECTQAGRLRYKLDLESGKVGKTVESRSGRNMPPHRPRRVSTAMRSLNCGAAGCPCEELPRSWIWDWEPSSGRSGCVPKVRSGHLEHQNPDVRRRT